jgi:hypothetical protein
LRVKFGKIIVEVYRCFLFRKEFNETKSLFLEKIKIRHPDFLQKKFGFRPKGTAFLRLRRLSDYFSRLRRERPARAARRKPARKGFATLRVAKKKCFGLGLGSSTGEARINLKFITNLFSFAPGERRSGNFLIF